MMIEDFGENIHSLGLEAREVLGFENEEDLEMALLYLMSEVGSKHSIAA
tara:strand:- start:423 stop:569 length:147 start_codon:yes stop_codon:yes gene_type:complete